MKKRMILTVCLILVFFMFEEGCKSPTEPVNNNDNDQICESQRYDVEFLYKRTKPPLKKDNGPFAEVTIAPSWDHQARDFEKTGRDTYKITIKDFYVNQPRSLANYKHDLAVIVDDYLLRDEQAEYPFRSTVVVEDISARVIGKTGYVKLTRNQPASICSNEPGIKEILVDLDCKGQIK